MKILITGICGFVGSSIARSLLEHLPGITICGIDSLIRRGSETNVGPLRALNIDVRIGDIRKREDLEQMPDPDWVIDCAANPSVLAGVDGKTGPRELLDHNLVGTVELLEFCRNRHAGFLLLSTSRVYSIPPLAALPVEVTNNAFHPKLDGGNFTKSSNPNSGISPFGISELFSTEPPVSLYGSSKRCSELLALEYGETFGFPVWINRCGVLAGAGQFGRADQGIFSYWIHSWAGRRPLKNIGFGGLGYQVRDCLHPVDIVPLLIRQMEDPSRSVPKIQNLSGGIKNSMSLSNLSDWCRERFGNHQVEADLTPRPFDIPWMVLDSTLAFESWGWFPERKLDSILEEIASHAVSYPDWLQLIA